MAASGFAYSLLPSTSLSSNHTSTPNNAFLPCRISLTRSHFSSKHTPKLSSFSVHCSLDAAPAQDPKKETTPIELTFPTVMDINQIRAILPHRFPFLLVDRVIEYNPGVSAFAIKNVTINDNFFPGHFPERPIMPGVLMVEKFQWFEHETKVNRTVKILRQNGL